MDRVGVAGQVDDLPDLGAAGLDDLGRLVHVLAAELRDRIHRLVRAEELDQAPVVVEGLVEGEAPDGHALGVRRRDAGRLLQQEWVCRRECGGQLDRRVGAADPGLDPDLEQRPGVGTEAPARRRRVRVAGEVVVDLFTVRIRRRGIAEQDQFRAGRDIPEVDDQVGPFGRREEQLVWRRLARVGRRRATEIDGSRQEPALGPDLHERRTGRGPGLGAVWHRTHTRGAGSGTEPGRR